MSYGITIKKPAKFDDIPQFNMFRGYAVDVGWGFLKKWMDMEFIHGNLDMDPDFQRGHVWTPEKRTAFVEFMLRGGDSASGIYFNCPGYMSASEDDDEFVLVDGKQRLTSALDFLNDKVQIFGGHVYSDFTDSLNLLRPRFRMHINNLPTRAEVLQWYLDLNTGGVVHTNDEIEKVKRLLAEEKKRVK